MHIITLFPHLSVVVSLFALLKALFRHKRTLLSLPYHRLDLSTSEQHQVTDPVTDPKALLHYRIPPLTLISPDTSFQHTLELHCTSGLSRCDLETWSRSCSSTLPWTSRITCHQPQSFAPSFLRHLQNQAVGKTTVAIRVVDRESIHIRRQGHIGSPLRLHMHIIKDIPTNNRSSFTSADGYAQLQPLLHT